MFWKSSGRLDRQAFIAGSHPDPYSGPATFAVSSLASCKQDFFADPLVSRANAIRYWIHRIGVAPLPEFTRCNRRSMQWIA